MSNQNEKYDNVEKVNTPAPAVSMDMLIQLFKEQAREAAADRKALAEAIRESKIPHVDPSVVAARKQAAEDRKALVEKVLRERQYAKVQCPHLNEGGKSNIKWMEHSNGIVLGVCGFCRSEFDATRNPEDAKLLRSDPKSIRNMGRAGTHARKTTTINI